MAENVVKPAIYGVGRRQRAQVNFNPGTPAAETFNALNVPMVNATRRTGVGDNARRLADSLRGFSATLGAVLGPMAEDEAKKRKDEIKVAELDAEQRRVYNDAGGSVEARHETSREIGYDPNIKMVQSDVEFRRYFPQFSQGLEAETKNLNDNDFYVMEEDEEGNPVRTNRQYTTDDINAMAAAKHKAIMDNYVIRNEDDLDRRQKMLEKVNAWKLSTLEAQSGAYTRVRAGLYKSEAPEYMSQHYHAGVAKGLKGQALYDHLFELEKTLHDKVFSLKQKDGTTTVIPSSFTRIQRTETILNALERADITSVEDAQARLDLIDKVKAGPSRPTSFRTDEAFRVQADKIRKASQIYIARDTRQKRADATHAENLKSVLNGTTRSELNLQPINEKYGDEGNMKDLPNPISVSTQEENLVKDVKKNVAERYGNLDAKGLAEETVRQLKGTGFKDPEIERYFEDWKFDPTGDIDQTELNARFDQYMAIKAGDPSMVSVYIKDKATREALAYIEDVVLSENVEGATPTPVEAAQAYADFKASGQEPAYKRRDYTKVFREWEASVENKLTTEQIESIRNRAGIRFANSNKDPSKIKDHLDEMVASETISNIEFNGSIARTPPGVSPSEWQAKLENVKNHPAYREELGGREETWVGYFGSFMRSNPGARLVRVDNGTRRGYRVVGPNDAPTGMFIRDKQINDLWAERKETEKAKNLKGAQDAIKGAKKARADAPKKVKTEKGVTLPFGRRLFSTDPKDPPAEDTSDADLRASQEDRQRQLYQDYTGPSR